MRDFDGGGQLRCEVRVASQEATLKRLEDGGLRVVALPETASMELVESGARD